MATFGSVTFAVLIDSSGVQYDTDVSGIHIPGGDITIFDIGGRTSGYLPLGLRMTDAAFASLCLLVGSQATLTYEGGTFANSLLKSLRRRPLPATGTTLADAEFITPT